MVGDENSTGLQKVLTNGAVALRYFATEYARKLDFFAGNSWIIYNE